ncbi:zeta toxin family protein [Streptodolium elevatio]
MDVDRTGIRTLRPGALPAAEAQELLASRILPTSAAASTRQQPVVVLVAGQPGAGKTVTADLVQAALERRGLVVRVCSDLYKAAHPSYAELLAADVRLAGIGVRGDVRRRQAEVEEHVRVHRLDAVVETGLADADEARAASAAYRAAGHRVELVVVATAPAASAQGILDRYLATHADGGGRWVSWENHDTCVAGLLSTLAVVEDERLVDRVTVVRRDHTVLYTNHLSHDGRWTGTAGAAAAVDAEHRRWWTAPETAAFRLGLTLSDRRLHREVVDEDRRLAVQRDAERAAALAEPVRRTAQAIREAPGVHYHRLSPAEHRWTFDALILPGYLADITAHDRPVTTYVMGQPGAGKTDAAYLVRRAARHRRPVGINGDNYKAMHPDYWKLLLEEPRTAGARIRADYTAWQRQAEAYVRAHRGDMTIEISPGDTEHFLACARADCAAGRRIELVVLGVRAADSRQGAAARYVRLARTGPARFTTAAGHDRCFTAIPHAVAAAEQAGLVDAVTVLRRDRTAAYRNERGPDGRWQHPLGAVPALLAEQHRPYTVPDAARFLSVQKHLTEALPQYRFELRDITRLAWPLLPVDLRPGTLAGPTSRAALPVRTRDVRGGYDVGRSFSRAS